MPAPNGAYVSLTDLQLYLRQQYGGMGGAAIATHKAFCDHIPGRLVVRVGAKGGPHPSSGTKVVYVPIASIGPYLKAQYSRRMNGGAIANHKWFLRSIPSIVFASA